MKEKLNNRLIVRYLSGRANSVEEGKIKQWMQSNPNNRELMEELKQIWKASGEKDEAFEELFSPEEGWEEFRNRTPYDQNEKKEVSPSAFQLNNKYSRISKRRFTQFMRVAAIVVVGSLLGLLTYQNLHKQPEAVEPVLHEISMEKGQRGNITLSDGTKVTLNAESKIILPNIFKSDKREVTLKGEAFFDVSHNPDRPFIINTGEAIVKVLGTSLDVRSYPGDKAVQVVVKEGRVSLKATKESVDDKAILSAGEMGQLFIKDNRITKKKVNDLDLFLSWRKGYLKFKNAPMQEVADQLERKYNIEVRFSDPDLKDLRITAELKSRRIQYNMDVISTSLNMEYKMDQEKVTFYRSKK